MDFIKNKYTRWYFSIIRRAASQIRTKSSSENFEKHHITPRSIGGRSSKENLVLLTLREHYICHLLLPRMLSVKSHRQKMIRALRMMSVTDPQHMRSRSYDQIKRSISENNKGANNPNYGNKWTDKQKETAAKRMRGRWSGMNNVSCRPEERLRRSVESRGNKNRNYGKSWICNGNEEKLVLRDMIADYEASGWTKGRVRR